MTQRYTCNLSGVCELDSLPEGRGYSTLEECTAECQASTEKELDYLFLEYTLDEDLDIYSIAPSDRVELIRRVKGVRVQSEDSGMILASIAGVDNDEFDTSNQIDTLLKYPQLWDSLYEYEMDASEMIAELGTLEALRWLTGKSNPMSRKAWSAYLKNSDYNEEAKGILFEEVRDMFWYLKEYNDSESDAPGYLALSYLSLSDPRAEIWYDELSEEYEQWQLDNP